MITRTIRSSTDPDQGYILVTVPVSGVAPHMVDSIYYGRGDKTKIRLSDTEVLRHHRGRKDTEETITALLEEYVRRDPVPADRREQAHMFIVAAPVSPRREMLLGAVDGPERWATFRELVNAGFQPPALMGTIRFSPDLHLAGTTAHRSDGVALTCGLTQDRRLDSMNASGETGALEIELTEEGVIRVFTGRLSNTQREVRYLLIQTVPVLVRRIVLIAGAVSDHAGYHGPWMFGVAATGINGLTAYSNEMSFRSDRPLPQDMTDYRQITTASAAELHQTPGAVTGRLVNRLLRAVDQTGLYDQFTTDPPPISDESAPSPSTGKPGVS